MKFKTMMVVSTLGLFVSACSANAMGEKQTVGGLLGAVGGGLAGAQFGNGKGQLASVAAGTLLGALIGSEAGRSLDSADQMAMGRSTQRALETAPSHQSVPWSNPDTGHSGQVIPQPAYTNTQGRYCREFQQTVIVGGQEQSAYGTACRQPDGSWQMVNGADVPVPHAYNDQYMYREKIVYVEPRRVHRINDRPQRPQPWHWR